MGLVLNMNHNWNQKVVIEHAGEKMEIFVKQIKEDKPRIKLYFVASKDWSISRESENGE